ncbi:MAG TPA: cytochrome d ubiquinol oxidase subunit II [Pseudonocardiaceae bacterium]|nr:cytochrome d ubiquinol oxidase subunit II [Pseudonocardiaceae bacterium]
MDLPTFWFSVVALFWVGYLFLEGFDFGVGMLLPILGRTETDRRVMINTIGPVWDGNEVWLIVAAGATFAAFPAWYAGLFSGAYLPLLILLVALIGRGVAFEYRGKVHDDRWRRAWDLVITVASWVAPLAVGTVIASTVLGLPLDAAGDVVRSPFAAFHPETLLGGVAVAGFALLHGSAFLTLKTEGCMRTAARRFALRIAPVAVVLMVALLLVVQLREGQAWTWVALAVCAVALVGSVVRLRADRDGQAFALLGLAVVAFGVTLFGALYPDVLPSTSDIAHSLTVHGAASADYTLTLMTWVAGFGAPAVLIYQGWTYWVFRRRIGTRHIPPVHTP